MNPALILTVLVSVFVQIWTFKLNGRIVGGEDADINDFPYQVSLLEKGSHSCGGSILSANTILCAAHCTYKELTEIFSIRAGSTIRNEGGEVVDVKTAHNHPQFDPINTDYDVTILILVTNLKWHGRISVLPVGAEVPTNTAATVTGWGSTGKLFLPKILQQVVVYTVSHDYCNDAYVFHGGITPRMMCAADDGKDSCWNDSGGPLVANGVQIGIVSWGDGCALPGIPGIYANLANKDVGDHVAQFL